MMKKYLIIVSCFFIVATTGCGKNRYVLECVQGSDTNKTIIQNNKIIEFYKDNENEKISDEEWKTLKNIYEFDENVTNDEIVDKLKKINEDLGYTCKLNTEKTN